ncbi:MAG: DUF364 domain-containing protein [Deltaproteobacteria bacterium]|nr:DUF364 domain-containing protein [Deltaproteobacteria bacterium]MBW2137995.1 DUF364 domain-containing protein [Deltaproteobacteria bacterium]
MGILGEVAFILEDRLGKELEGLEVERFVVGLFFSGVKLSNGAGGVCYTPVKEIPKAICCPTSAGRIFDPRSIRGMPVKRVLSELSSPEPIKTAGVVSVLNALSSILWERGLERYDLLLNRDALDLMDFSGERSVAVVGAMVPVLRTLKMRGGPWWVVEKDPGTLRGEEVDHYVPVDQCSDVIGKAEILVITGVTILNRTLEGILGMARPDGEIAVVGPTASMLPGPMFDRGVKIVGGVWVRKPDELLDLLSMGASGYHFFDTLADRTVMTNPKAKT